MDIQQLKLFYHFEQYEDQTGKAERFIQDLEELESLAKRLQGVIMDETDQSKGNLIESINEVIEEKVTYSDCTMMHQNIQWKTRQRNMMTLSIR